MPFLTISAERIHHYKALVRRWESCKLCPLRKDRQNVVQVRGFIPAPVLFIGEAPGYNEDSLGWPFIGKSGTVLDRIISEVEIPRYAIANVVGCIPMQGYGVRKPQKAEVVACNPRLQSLIKLVNPRCIIQIGKVAGMGDFKADCQIVHPAAMLRERPFKYVVHFKRSVHRISRLRDMWES